MDSSRRAGSLALAAEGALLGVDIRQVVLHLHGVKTAYGQTSKAEGQASAAEDKGNGTFDPACAAIIHSLPTKRAQFPYLQEMAQKK